MNDDLVYRDEPSASGGGSSRRTVIKRMAIGAGVVWAAPAVMSVGSAASAASPFPDTGNCGVKFVCGDTANCGPEGAGCLCTLTTEGVLFCSNNFSCADVARCLVSSDCPAGWQCQAADTGCCGQGYCLPPCGLTQAVGGGGATNAG